MGHFTLMVKWAVHCIAAENRQGAFLVAEKLAGHIFSSRNMGRAHFKQQKNWQGTAPS